MLINTLIDTIYNNSLQKLDMTQKDVKGFNRFKGCVPIVENINNHKQYKICFLWLSEQLTVFLERSQWLP